MFILENYKNKKVLVWLFIIFSEEQKLNGSLQEELKSLKLDKDKVSYSLALKLVTMAIWQWSVLLIKLYYK